MNVIIHVADSSHLQYAQTICDLVFVSAQARGTGIAKRTPEYIQEKMNTGKSVIALDGDILVGFAYIETWEHKKYVANSGLIVHPDYRGMGIAKKIKQRIFDLSRTLYPNSKIFSITTGLAVMKMNTELGFKPVTFSELTSDKEFWKGCQGCQNFDILQRNDYKMCLCTGLLYDSKEKEKEKEKLQIIKPIEGKIVKPIIKKKNTTKIYKKRK